MYQYTGCTGLNSETPVTSSIPSRHPGLVNIRQAVGGICEFLATLETLSASFPRRTLEIEHQSERNGESSSKENIELFRRPQKDIKNPNINILPYISPSSPLSQHFLPINSPRVRSAPKTRELKLSASFVSYLSV